MAPLRIEPLATTAIGSLPETDVEAALEQAFSLDLPFLPELPRRDPAEGMLARALEGLAGLRIDADGQSPPVVAIEPWRRERGALERRLTRALADGDFSPFEPSARASRAFEPFLAQLRRRGVRLAKAQLAGPATAVWSVRLEDGRPASAEPELARQIARLVAARALALAQAIARAGAAPVVFLDEPALISLEPRNPQHSLRLGELRELAAGIVRAGGRAGLHCCAESRWSALMPLGFSYLSIDVARSLPGVLADRPLLERFLEDGGRLALGLVPTEEPLSGAAAAGALLDRLEGGLPEPLVGRILTQALLTPACGLAGLSVPRAREILRALGAAKAELAARLV